MSIISEALKKAQEKNIQFRKKGISPGPVIKIDKAKPKGKRIWFMTFAIIFVSISAFIASGLVTEAMRNLSTPPPAIKDYRVAVPTEKKIDTASVKVPEPGPSIERNLYPPDDLDERLFKLSGIVFGAGKPFAVINNRILEEGDQIGEAKVINIEKNKVRLLFNEREIVLLLK